MNFRSSWSPLTKRVCRLWQRGQGASENGVFDGESNSWSASLAAVHSWARFHGESNVLLVGIGHDTLEGKAQRIHVHAGENSDPHPDRHQPRSRPARGLGKARFQNRAGNADFVHQRRPGAEHACGQSNESILNMNPSGAGLGSEHARAASASRAGLHRSV